MTDKDRTRNSVYFFQPSCIFLYAASLTVLFFFDRLVPAFFFLLMLATSEFFSGPADLAFAGRIDPHLDLVAAYCPSSFVPLSASFFAAASVFGTGSPQA